MAYTRHRHAALTQAGCLYRKSIGASHSLRGESIIPPASELDTIAGKLSSAVTFDHIAQCQSLEALTMNIVQSHAFQVPPAKNISKPNDTRLQQLSDEVGRIATALARLAAAPTSDLQTSRGYDREVPQVSAETVRGVIRARRLRDNFFPSDLFADPAWDMLLDLFHAELSQFRVPVSSLCIAAAVPATTALRWLKTMADKGLVVRRADPHDGRRVFVELSPQTSFALRSYFAEVDPIAVV